MRRIIGSAFVSVDGVIQSPGAPHEDETGGFAYGGWVAPHWDGTLEKHLGALFADPYDLLLGYRTHEIFAAYWPHARADNPIGAAFNQTAAKGVPSAAELDRRARWAREGSAMEIQLKTGGSA